MIISANQDAAQDAADKGQGDRTTRMPRHRTIEAALHVLQATVATAPASYRLWDPAWLLGPLACMGFALPLYLGGLW